MLTIHKASAGSGKTFALAKTYIKLLLGRKRPDGGYALRPLVDYSRYKPKAHGEITAVTFSNKATQEMTERIIRELAILANPDLQAPPGDYLAEFMTDFRADRATIARHAGAALEDLLFNFSWFNVSTIDAFFQRVLNTFTRELEISPSHGVEIDDSYAIGIAVGKMLQSINFSSRTHAESREDKDLRRHLENWLLRYMRTNLEEGMSANLLSRSSGTHSNLLGRMTKFYNEQYKINREKIDEYFSDYRRIVRFNNALDANSPYFRGKWDEISREASVVLTLMGGEGSKNARAMLEAMVAKDEKLLAAKTPATVSENPEKAFLKSDNPADNLKDRLQKLCRKMLALADDLEFMRLLQKNVFQLGLFGQVNRFLDEYRHENDRLLLSDTGDLLSEIINEEETPFIYERMGTSVKSYLIDEFQDTSQMQWANLSPLVLESLSQGNDDLIIGDVKQCIYRFRNSDPELFGSEVERQVSTRFPGNVEIKGVEVRENTNWRSAPAVVEFNNTLFHVLARMLDGSAERAVETTYDGLVQQVAAKNSSKPGYVKVRFLQSSDVAQQILGSDLRAEEKNAQIEQMQLEALTDEIQRELDAGFRPNQIAVLVRKGWQSKKIVSHLMAVMENPQSSWRHGKVPIVSADSIPIGMSHAVRLIINVMRLVAEPAKILSQKQNGTVEVPNGTFQRCRLIHRFELERYSTVKVRDDEGNMVEHPISDSEALARAVLATTSAPGDAGYDPVQRETDEKILALSGIESPSLGNLTEHIIKEFLPGGARSRDLPFIVALQDLVLEFSEQGNNSVHAFLDWWDSRGRFTNVEAPADLPGINVMTIHKSKGLEFECVHIPFFSSEIIGEDSAMRPSLSWYGIDATGVPFAEPADVPPFVLLPNRLANKKFKPISRQVEKWAMEQTVDALNVAYVAFTRAVSELVVYADRNYSCFLPDSTVKKSSSKKDGAGEAGAKKRWGDYLYDALTQTTAASLAGEGLALEKRKWMVPLAQNEVRNSDCGEVMFEIGTPVIPSASGDCRGDDVPGDGKSEVQMNAAATDYCVNSRAQIFAEREKYDREKIERFDFNNERHRGIFLHNVLSRVRHINDLENALMIQSRKNHLAGAQRQECLALLRDALADARVRPWFENFTRAIMERPLAGVQQMHRPDRVVWMPDGHPVVIDYKFGAANHREYQEQVRDYCGILARAGFPGAEGYLWFPLKGEIIRIV